MTKIEEIRILVAFGKPVTKKGLAESDVTTI